MEAETTVFEGIDGAAQPGESGESGGRLPGDGTVAVRTPSRDGIRAPWATGGAHQSAKAPRRFVSSVGAGCRRGKPGKLGVTLLALTGAALVALVPPLTPEAGAQELPKVTIAAKQASFGLGVDDVIFILTRTGPGNEELTVGVSLMQEEMFLPQALLRLTATFDAGASTAELKIGRFHFTSPVTRSGVLKATVAALVGYTPGRPGMASTRLVVRDPAVTVRLSRGDYRFDEDGNDAGVGIVARTVADLPRPSTALHVAVSTRSVSGGATPSADYEALSVEVAINPDDFSAVGGVWEARKEVAFTIVDDTERETDEAVNVLLERTPRLPERVAIRHVNGSVCPAAVCSARVTIVDDDGSPVDDDGAPSAPRNLSLVPGDGVATLIWEASADDGGRPVLKHQYRVRANAGTSWDPDWTDIPRSAPGDGNNTTSYLVRNLVNDTEHTFEVRAVSDSGAGEVASGATTPSAMVGSVHGICDRTPAVRDRLMVLLRRALTPGYAGDCAGVTDAWLVRLTSVQLIAPYNRVTSLERGDFAGLSRVNSVYIVGQSGLATLPTGVFDGLAGIEEFWIFDNGITTLAAGAFRDLPRLRDIFLHDNRISRLAHGAFAGLRSLVRLVVSGCVKARINGEQRIAHPAICGAGDDSERWVGI